MVALQKADTNLDEVVNDVNNLVNCPHCHGPFFFFFFFFLSPFLSVLYMCVGVWVCLFSFLFFFFFFVLYLRYMNERQREGGRRERKKLYCNGWIHVNE